MNRKYKLYKIVEMMVNDDPTGEDEYNRLSDAEKEICLKEYEKRAQAKALAEFNSLLCSRH